MAALIAVWMMAALAVPTSATEKSAREVDIVVTVDGEEKPGLTDGSYETLELLPREAQIRVQSPGGEKMAGLYLTWAARPAPWTLTSGEGETEQGKNGFLHEYAFAEPAADFTITLGAGEALCDIRAYSEGVLPEDVQVWEPPCVQADLLLFPAHADDEILFFGGVLAEYGGQRGLNTQVAYFSEYNNVREHEKLDGLWASGIRNYPVHMGFTDVKPENQAQAREIFGEEKALECFVEQIRRFRPQICVGHDVDGEYGHATHIFVSDILRRAVDVSMDPAAYPDSALRYGLWDVPKTYLHLWKGSPIHLDCRKPLPAFGGRTALEVATNAYTRHVSQQWCWFYVSDDNAYSIADFGLYRSTVGTDTGNDMMEHLVPRRDQDEEVPWEPENS